MYFFANSMSKPNPQISDEGGTLTTVRKYACNPNQLLYFGCTKQKVTARQTGGMLMLVLRTHRKQKQ